MCEWRSYYVNSSSIRLLPYMRLSTYLGPAQKVNFLEIAWFLFHGTDNYYDFLKKILPAFLHTLESKSKLKFLARVNYQCLSKRTNYQCPVTDHFWFTGSITMSVVWYEGFRWYFWDFVLIRNRKHSYLQQFPRVSSI